MLFTIEMDLSDMSEPDVARLKQNMQMDFLRGMRAIKLAIRREYLEQIRLRRALLGESPEFLRLEGQLAATVRHGTLAKADRPPVPADERRERARIRQQRYRASRKAAQRAKP